MTLAELRERLAERAQVAAAMNASAPVADVLTVILGEMAQLEDAAPPADRLLTVEEVAERLGVRPRLVYDMVKQMPFARKIGRRTLRFSEAGLQRWLDKRRAA